MYNYFSYHLIKKFYFRSCKLLKQFSFVVLLITLLNSCSKIDFLKTPDAGLNNNSFLKLQSKKPNVILILGDDVGFEIPACNGGQSYQTPNIDKLSEQAMRFEQAYGCPDCSPSRFMLLTGKYNQRNYDIWGIMSADQKTIGNMFSDAGYSTYYAGKWQLDGGDTSIHTFGFQNIQS